MLAALTLLTRPLMDLRSASQVSRWYAGLALSSTSRIICASLNGGMYAPPAGPAGFSARTRGSAGAGAGAAAACARASCFWTFLLWKENKMSSRRRAPPLRAHMAAAGDRRAGRSVAPEPPAPTAQLRPAVRLRRWRAPAPAPGAATPCCTGGALPACAPPPRRLPARSGRRRRWPLRARRPGPPRDPRRRARRGPHHGRPRAPRGPARRGPPPSAPAPARRARAPGCRPGRRGAARGCRRGRRGGARGCRRGGARGCPRGGADGRPRGPRGRGRGPCRARGCALRARPAHGVRHRARCRAARLGGGRAPHRCHPRAGRAAHHRRARGWAGACAAARPCHRCDQGPTAAQRRRVCCRPPRRRAAQQPRAACRPCPWPCASHGAASLERSSSKRLRSTPTAHRTIGKQAVQRQELHA